MKTWMIVLLAIAIPVLAQAAGKTHIKTDNQECAECHAGQEEAWLGGKHGLMNVKCVVCHGSPEENFMPKPRIERCRGCHGENVADMEKKLAVKERTCFSCHDNHTVAVKPAAAKTKGGFHTQGGTR